MQDRPLFNIRVEELERLFDERRADNAFLEILIGELRSRKTQRSQDLLKRAVTAADLPAPSAVPMAVIAKIDAPAPARAETQAPNFQSELLYEKASAPEEQKAAGDAKPIENKPADILSAWTGIEVLSPSSFRRPEDLAGGDRYRIAAIDGRSLLWKAGEKSRQNYRLYYQVILGTIRLEPAISGLLEKYSDSRAERPSTNGEAVLATVMLDKEGRLVDPDPVAVSSFGWGVPGALNGDLRQLDRWPQVGPTIVEKLSQRLSAEDEDGNPLPLTAERIDAAYAWLVRGLGLTAVLVKAPAFIVRSYQYFKTQDPPESIPLNSYFLEDLSLARASARAGSTPSNLRRFLQETPPQTRTNLMNDEQALRATLEPARFPLGSWPAAGRSPLSILQQCAVNTVSSDLKDGGIVAVNGPPGTGKTTLLRDIIASVITERAAVLCTYQDPQAAFTRSGQKIRKGGGFVHLYSMDAKVRSFEMPALQLRIFVNSESIDLHDSEVMDDGCVNRDDVGTLGIVAARREGSYSKIVYAGARCGFGEPFPGRFAG